MTDPKVDMNAVADSAPSIVTVCSIPGCLEWPAEGHNVCGEHLEAQKAQAQGATREANPVFHPDQIWEQVQRAAIHQTYDTKEERDEALREAGLK